MQFKLLIWRQNQGEASGHLAPYDIEGIKPSDTLLDLLDKLNEDLLRAGRGQVAFEQECRKGACGLCALVINGRPHGPGARSATCQVQMRAFDDGSTLTIEPWRARPFPVKRDLVVDRSALGRILDAGALPSTASSLAATQTGVCIECGACAAACRNASASLFLGAKAQEHTQRPSPRRRVLDMSAQMDLEGFGACSNDGVCEAICPKGITVDAIAALNRAWLKAAFRGPET